MYERTTNGWERSRRASASTKRPRDKHRSRRKRGRNAALARRHTLLVVDAEETRRTNVRHALRGRGHYVLEADDCDSATTLLSAIAIHGVIVVQPAPCDALKPWLTSLRERDGTSPELLCVEPDVSPTDVADMVDRALAPSDDQ